MTTQGYPSDLFIRPILAELALNRERDSMSYKQGWGFRCYLCLLTSDVGAMRDLCRVMPYASPDWLSQSQLVQAPDMRQFNVPGPNNSTRKADKWKTDVVG